MKKRIFALCAVLALSLSLLSGCAKPGANDSTPPKEEKDADLAAFAQTLQENHDFPSLDKLDPKDPDVGAIMMENTYPGLKDMDLEQIEVYLAIISFTAGELSLVEAKSADDAAKVEGLFQARIDSKSTDGIGNYPEEVETWQRSARVVSHGNYVMLVCHEDADAIVDEFNALFA